MAYRIDPDLAHAYESTNTANRYQLAKSGTIKNEDGTVTFGEISDKDRLNLYANRTNEGQIREVNKFLEANPGYSTQYSDGSQVVRTFTTTRNVASGAGDGRGSVSEPWTISVYGPAAKAAAAAPGGTPSPADPAKAQEAMDRVNQYQAQEREIRDRRLSRPAPSLNYTPGAGGYNTIGQPYEVGNGVQSVSRLASDLWNASATDLNDRYAEADASSKANGSYLEAMAYTLPPAPKEKSSKDLIEQAKEYASIFRA